MGRKDAEEIDRQNIADLKRKRLKLYKEHVDTGLTITKGSSKQPLHLTSAELKKCIATLEIELKAFN